MYQTRYLPNTRIDVADALRGIAVAGIILYHSRSDALLAAHGIVVVVARQVSGTVVDDTDADLAAFT
ncbi:MAG: hypothetical protein IIT40_04240, partial [Prevotella sp.]|nr:hypothetical protein [Prevotella sp.]